MNFSPLSDEQIEALKRKLQPGNYTFEVSKATEKKSKDKGLPMMELILKVFDKDGHEFIVYDYLVSTENGAWKIKHFCESINESQMYQSGQIDEIYVIGKSGNLSTKIENYTDKEGVKRERVKVVDYLKPVEDEFNDDIPF